MVSPCLPNIRNRGKSMTIPFSLGDPFLLLPKLCVLVVSAASNSIMGLQSIISHHFRWSNPHSFVLNFPHPMSHNTCDTEPPPQRRSTRMGTPTPGAWWIGCGEYHRVPGVPADFSQILGNLCVMRYVLCSNRFSVNQEFSLFRCSCYFWFHEASEQSGQKMNESMETDQTYRGLVCSSSLSENHQSCGSHCGK